jgi:hypothetical protein
MSTILKSILLVVHKLYTSFVYKGLYTTSKCVPVHAMKSYRGSRGITPLILSLGTAWR